MGGRAGCRIHKTERTPNKVTKSLCLPSHWFLLQAALWLLFWLFSFPKAVKPAAESYEKQKQFITDANHELKTPLTLIRTNLDIMESEIGTNEWLSDIRKKLKSWRNWLIVWCLSPEWMRITPNSLKSFSLSGCSGWYPHSSSIAIISRKRF